MVKVHRLQKFHLLDELIVSYKLFFISPGCNRFIYCKCTTKTLFRNFFGHFSVLLYINSINLLLIAFIGNLKMFSMRFSIKWYGRRQKHSIDFHNVDGNNRFFINLFKRQNNVFHGKKCLSIVSFYSILDLKLIIIFCLIMILVKMCFRKSLLIIQI